MEPSDRAYVSVLSWPPGWGHARRVEAMVRAGGMDPYDAGMMARRATPAIVQACDALVRGDILSELHRLGVMAVAPSRSELESYPRAETPARVTRFSGSPPRGFSVHTRDGGAWTFTPGDVRLVVAGMVRAVGKITRHSGGSNFNYAAGMAYGGIGGVGAMAAADAMDAETAGWGSNTSRNTRAVETIDLHLVMDGRIRVVRLAGGSTRIGEHGTERTRPSLIDTHRPVEDLKGWLAASGPVFDEWFPNFNTPADVEAVAARAGQSSSRLNPVAFDFYSVWVAMLDRAVRGW
jgi:hypothetical protein